MRLGIFARTFARSTLEGVLDQVRAHGLDCVQFNLCCAGLATLPDRLDQASAGRIAAAHGDRGIEMAAISGTFNMIHPDPEQRSDGLRRLGVLAAACRQLGTGLITLCTGTRDRQNMWRRHPENDSATAWRDLVESMQRADAIAREHQVLLGIEPEVNNVVDTALKARRLLDEIGSPRVKVVMDAANLFHAGQLPRIVEVLEEAFELLGSDIALAHAKDLSRDGDSGDVAAGTGLLDYGLYLRLLDRAGYEGPLILHGLDESEVAGAVAFIDAALEKLRLSPNR